MVGLATTFEADYKEELTAAEDPTLGSTNLHQVRAPHNMDYPPIRWA